MTKLSRLLGTPLLLSLLVGCGSKEPDAPGELTNDPSLVRPNDDAPSLSSPEEQAELSALEIGQDEAIVDEGDVAAIYAEASLPDNPLDTDPDGVTDSDIEDDGTADDVRAASLHALDLSNAPVGSTKTLQNSWTCVTRINGVDRRDNLGKCVCAGSPLNCEVPNKQPGKNRLLRATWESDIAKANVPSDKRGDFLGESTWDIENGTILYEGGGAQRGELRGTCFVANPDPTPTAPFLGDTSHYCVAINYGQVKYFTPVGGVKTKFVYAFSGHIGGTHKDEGISASGWIPIDDIGDNVRSQIDAMPTAAPARPKSMKLSSTKYVVKSATDYPDTPTAFMEAKVGNHPEQDTADSNHKVGDYLLHDNIINLAFGTPGVGGPATDTRLVQDHSLRFRRAVSTTKYPTLVYSKTTSSSRKRLIFAYGEIGGRFGWLATPAFETGDYVAPADKCTGVPDSTACDVALGYTGRVCRGGKTVKLLSCPIATPNCQGGDETTQTLKCVDTAMP